MLSKMTKRADWFQDEALELSRITKIQKAKIQKLSAKVMDLEQTNFLLQHQVNKMQKKESILRTEIKQKNQ
jgi:hypothetical protein